MRNSHCISQIPICEKHNQEKRNRRYHPDGPAAQTVAMAETYCRSLPCGSSPHVITILATHQHRSSFRTVSPPPLFSLQVVLVSTARVVWSGSLDSSGVCDYSIRKQSTWPNKLAEVLMGRVSAGFPTRSRQGASDSRRPQPPRCVPDKQANNREVVVAGVELMPQVAIRYRGRIRGGQRSTAHLPFQVQ
jgi:hypothetical protein